MTTQNENPLDQALTALDQIAAADMDPVVGAAWRVLHEAILATQEERSRLLAVAREARAFVAILDGYEEALDSDAPGLIAELAAASEAAEGALAEVLSRIPLPQAGETPLPGEAALLALMERFDGVYDDEEQLRQ